MRRQAAAACALAVLACAPGAPLRAGNGPVDEGQRADTLRGTVVVAGSEPLTQVVLRTAAGDVVLDGARRVLERVAGLEVAVEGGRQADGRFRVERMEVRASAGVPAVDGTLAREGERWVLLTADGRRFPIARLPAPLRAKAGARVWLAGPLDRAPDSWGVIEEAP